MKRTIYLAMAALIAMLILMPAALAQDMLPGDDDPLLPEQGVVEVGSHEELEQIVGQSRPQQIPDEPIDQPGGSLPQESLPQSGGPIAPSVLLPAALLLGSGVLVSYAVLRRRR